MNESAEQREEARRRWVPPEGYYEWESIDRYRKMMKTLQEKIDKEIQKVGGEPNYSI